jgi:hypothetical protein
LAEPGPGVESALVFLWHHGGGKWGGIFDKNLGNNFFQMDLCYDNFNEFNNLRLEAAPGIKPGDHGFAGRCLITWLCRLDRKDVDQGCPQFAKDEEV